MHFTFECELVGLSDSDRRALDDLMLRFSSAKRIAFNRLLERRKVNEVTHDLESLGSLSLNWRYCEHAARDALAEIASQKELLPLYLADVYDKIEGVQKKVWRLENSTRPLVSAEKLLGRRTRLSLLESRLGRLEKREEMLSKHVAHGTIPKVIFGSRRLFVERARGKATREQWRDSRNNQLYSIGQSNAKGNANARIHPDGDKIGINFPHGIVPRATRKGVVRVENERRWFGLRVPEKFGRYLEQLLRSGHAYSVRLIRRDARYFAHVSFEIHGTEMMKHPPERVMSIDTNPEGFAVAVMKSDGNLLAHRFFRDDRLVYASARKRDAIIGELVSKIVEYGESHDAFVIATEDLKMRNGKNFGRKGNRVIHAFVRRKFFDNLLMKCWKESIPVLSVSPAYTSKVGDVKYRERYGLSIHEAAALCIGRRFYCLGEKLEEPLTITVKSGRSKMRMPVRRVWASIYGYHRPSDPYREPPRRKGSGGATTDCGNGAAFTGHPAGRDATSEEHSDEGERKGGECGGNPQATGYGGEPAPSSAVDGGKVAATSLRDSNNTQKTTPD